MSNKARFPAKLPKNIGGRTRVSWHETKNDSAKDTEFSKVAREVKLNMKAFRHVYCLPQSVGKPFRGFDVEDHRLEIFKQKVAAINKEIISLKGLTESMSLTCSVDANAESKPSSTEVVGRSSILTESAHTRKRKLGFEPKYLWSGRQNLSGSLGNSTDKQLKIASSNECLQDKVNASANDSASLKSSDLIKSGPGNANSDGDYTCESSNRSEVLVRTPNFRRIKGARIKRVRQGDLNNCLGILRDMPCMPKNTAKNLQEIDQARAGSARSGKYLLESELDDALDVEDSSITNSCDEYDSDTTDSCILEIPEQFKFRGFRPKSNSTMIKALCPLDSHDVEQNGFPVVVDSENGSCPHKPLCFLCGSAGIQQVQQDH